MEKETKFLVLDTNIILLDATNILTLGKDATIILPETVVDELDSKKSVIGEIGYQARSFGRMIASSKDIGIERTDSVVISTKQVEDITVSIVSVAKYPDFKESADNIINDRRIIYVAELMSKTYDTTFVTNDVMCGIRAESLGIKTVDYKDVEETSFEFTKALEVPPELFSTLHNKNISCIDENYRPENFNYRFTCSHTNQVKLATITNGIIDIIGKTKETELRRQDVTPANSQQLLLSQAIQDKNTDVVICEAKAGSGKTLVALSNAIKLVKTNTPYSSIIYLRNSVDDVGATDEEIGFLSGNSEKLEVYMHPLHDSIKAIVRTSLKASKLSGKELDEAVTIKADKLISDCNIEGLIGIGTRGRTFEDCVFIMDEAQNMGKSTMLKLLTRIGKNCKVIITGSLNQIDSKYITRWNSGLSVVLDSCRKENSINLHAVNLDKVVRGPITEWAEGIFT